MTDTTSRMKFKTVDQTNLSRPNFVGEKESTLLKLSTKSSCLPQILQILDGAQKTILATIKDNSPKIN